MPIKTIAEFEVQSDTQEPDALPSLISPVEFTEYSVFTSTR
jgi:hypothetical protein